MTETPSFRERAPTEFAEIDRIMALSIVDAMPEDVIDEITASVINPRAPAGFRLKRAQAEALQAWRMFGTMFGKIAVGGGKTLTNLLIAQDAYDRGFNKILLFLPGGLFAQLFDRDIPWARARVKLSVPIHRIDSKLSAVKRRTLAASGYKGLYCLPYSLASVKDTDLLLGLIKPEIVMFDEIHALRNGRAARTKRIKEYIEEFEPRVLGASGTITGKKLGDYAHIARWVLRDMAPIPLNAKTLMDWAMILDAGAEPGEKSGTPLLPLVDWMRLNFPNTRELCTPDATGFRVAFEKRFTSAPGVVTVVSDVNASILIENKPVKDAATRPGWAKLSDLIRRVDAGITPSGDEIEFGFFKFRCYYELTAGGYNKLQWDEPERIAEDRGVSLDEADELLEKSQAQHDLQNDYNKLLREFLDGFSRSGLDTPKLVGLSISRDGAKRVGQTLSDAWHEARAARFPGMLVRRSTQVRVCDYKINAAVEWAKEHKAGVIWYYHNLFGRWLTEALEAAGVDVLFCPAKEDSTILDPSHRNRIIVASLSAHREGKNLQHFNRMACLQFPRSASWCEQMLGRMHREGQQADEVVCTRFDTIDFDHAMLYECLVDACYIDQTTGVGQKAVIASYDPVPRIFPPEWLKSRGIIRTVRDRVYADAHRRLGLS